MHEVAVAQQVVALLAVHLVERNANTFAHQASGEVLKSTVESISLTCETIQMYEQCVAMALQ